MVKVLNTLSGQVVDVSEKTLKHPVLGKNFVAVDGEQKSYVPEMYEPKDAETFVAQKGKRSKKNVNTELEVTEEVVADYFAETEDK